jgi:hypothetical protein
VKDDVMPGELWLLGACITGVLPVVVFPIMFPGVQWYHALIAVLAGEEEGRRKKGRATLLVMVYCVGE